MALNMNKNLARVVLQRSMPVEDDVLKLHVEKIVLAVGKQKHKKQDKRQITTDPNALHASHQNAIQALNQQVGPRLSNPIQICESMNLPVPTLGGGGGMQTSAMQPQQAMQAAGDQMAGQQAARRTGPVGPQQQFPGMRWGAAAEEAQRMRQMHNASAGRGPGSGHRTTNSLALAFAAVQAANSGRLNETQMGQVMSTLRQQAANGSVECRAALRAISTNTPLQQHLPPQIQQQLQQLQAAKVREYKWMRHSRNTAMHGCKQGCCRY